jgi:hypothetical protein
MTKASLFYDARRDYPDGTIIQIRIWKIPETNDERPHGFKYSLFFGRPGERLVGYDNERGKGDHKHIKGFEYPYSFSSIDQLFADFRRDIAIVRRHL